MNKIYKVVWSKAKHCYVVTSELAKRNGKGCGARSLRMATVSMGVAAALLCTGHSFYSPSVAEAGSSNNTKTVEADVDGNVYGGLARNSVPDGAVYGGYSSNTFDSVDYNTVNIKSGTVKYVYGGYTSNGKATGNNVSVTGGTVNGSVSGGYVNNEGGGAATDNTVSIGGSTSEINIMFEVHGGCTYWGSGKVSGNQVTIGTGVTVNWGVYGGETKSGIATGNKVFIEGGTQKSYGVYGGKSSKGKATSNEVTVNSGNVGNVYGGYAGGDAETNHVVVNDGMAGGLSGYNLYGAYSYNDSGNSGNVTGNTVTVKKGTVMATVYGGDTKAEGTGNQSGDATKNTVTIEDGTLAGSIYGGYSSAQYKTSGNVEGNQVEIKGGVLKSAPVTINGTNYTIDGVRYIRGGYTYGYDKDTETSASGIAKDNVVTISGGMFRSDVEVTGGESNANNAEHNIVTLTDKFTGTVGTVKGGVAGGNGTATKNEVTVSGGTVSGKVYGGQSGNGTAGGDTANDGNKVTIGSGTVKGIVYGGYTDSGDAKFNTVTISESGQVNNTVYGGCSENGGKTIGNTVTVGDSAKVTGGITAGFSPKSDAENNTVTVNNGTVSGYINGGVATGTAKENHIIINNGTVSYMQGGSGASATGNTIEVNNGTVSNTIRGGNSDAGTVSDNIVTINDGKVNGTIYGGSSNSGAVTNNKVTVTGGAINDIIWGGDSNGGDAKYNAVTISGGAKIVVEGIMGGRSWNSEATGNTVTISGGSFEPESQDPPFNTISITAGVSNANKLTAKDNVVNITGEVTGLDTAEISGYNYNVTTHSGNELHVGGTKTYDSNGTATVSSSAAWQGKSSDGTVNNKVKSVAQFESIVLHNVKWGTTLPVLEATKITNIGTLDITNMQFDQTPSNGENMALLKAGNDLGVVGIGLAYKDGSTEKTATSAELATGVTFDSGALTDTAVNGVSVTGTQNKKVSLENSNYEIRYAFSSTISGITIATNTFTAGGTARAFGSGDNLTGATITNNLAFSDESKNSMQSGESMVILDATNAVAVSGATLPAFTEQTYKENFSDAISGKIVTLSGTHTDTLALNTAQTQLIYTVGDKNVETATFNGAVDFSTDDAYYKADSQYKFGKTNVDAQKLTFNETTEALAKGSSMTLLSATNITAGTVTQPDAPTVAIKYGGDATNGITFNAAATGSVAVEDSAVKFKVNTVEASKIDLSNWNGTESTVTVGWILADGAKVETGSFEVAGMNPGDCKTVLMAASGTDFSGLKQSDITGNNAWKDGGPFEEKSHASGVTIKGETSGGGVKVNDDKRALVYQQDKKNVSDVTLGTVAFVKDGTARSFDNAYDLTAANINADNFALEDKTVTMNSGDEMVIVDATNAIKGTDGATLKEFAKQNAGDAIAFEDKIARTVLTFSGTHQDTLEQDEARTQILYKVGDKNVTGVKFDGEVAWSDSAYYEADAGYKFAATNVDAAGLTVTGSSTAALKKGDAMTLLSAEGMKANITAAPADAGGVDLSYTDKGISFTGKTKGEVKTADNAVKYEVTGVGVNSVDIGEVTWQKNATLVKNSDASYDFTGVKEIGTKNFAVTYADGVPQTVVKGDSMTLLAANNTLTAMVSEEKAKVEKTYSVTPVDGVTVSAKLTSNVTNDSGNVKVTAASNQATALKFEKVEWTGDTALIDHSKTLTNVSFDGATVDTSGIDFYKEMYIEADQTTTLVDGFDGKPGEIKDGTYLVGTAYEGEGTASVENGKLIYRTTTAAGLSEQTHKTVMAMEAGMALLAGGGEHVGKALESLGDVANQDSDGTSIGVSIGGAGNRYETGSHVNVNSWNAALAIGAKRELKQGSLEYGVFGEYGKGSYKLYNDDGGKGDGDAHYAGGGLMAKWMNSHDVYAEASFRLGRMSDSADNILEGGGNKYGYDVHANYYGAHVGVGKVFSYKGGKSLDVYGKYFYTKRDGVEYDAKQHYNLDAVASSVLRIGARYGTTGKLWNWYGGLAYEYEFDGEATGTVNGTAIRAASIKGSSVRGELGMKMSATKDNPWQADISIYGYGGKHRGFGGNVSVAYTF